MPGTKLFTPAELDSGTWGAEVKRVRGKKHPLHLPGSSVIKGGARMRSCAAGRRPGRIQESVAADVRRLII